MMAQSKFTLLFKLPLPGNYIRSHLRCAHVAVKSCTEIPGPKRIPFYKMPEQLKKIEGKLNKFDLEMYKEFGPLVRNIVPILGWQVFFIFDPVLIESVLRQDSEQPVRPRVLVWLDYRKRAKQAFGIFTSDGGDWSRMRKIVDKPMLKPKSVEMYAEDMSNVAEDLVNRFEVIRGENMIVENLAGEMFNWALESIGTVLYEKRMGCLTDNRDPENDRFIKSVRNLFETTLNLFVYPPLMAKIFMRQKWKIHNEAWDTLFRVAEQYTNIKLEEIKNVKREEGDNVGFIEYLISQKDLSRKEVYANITELMAGGVDTTSNTVQFLFYEIAKSPEIQSTIYQEIQQYIPENDYIRPENLKNMKYLKAAIKETLRLFPVVNQIGRLIQIDMVLNGYNIPKGSYAIFSPYVLGRQESIFTNANDFRPERWLRDERGDQSKIPAFGYLPFGFGPRMCIGRRIADMEIQILVIQMLRKFRLELVDDKPIDTWCDLVISPAEPLRLRYIDRK